ncbi:hypothetical protein N9R54_00345 [Pelobium sp.]|nr:hypothetical protein [Pelobium sp.]MDA9554657.1 hypothetical protein [Pelobium sp.]
MNTQNFDYLKSNLKYFGFGERMNDELEKNIKAQKKDFKLNCEIPHFNNKMNYTLHFKKSDNTDMYFFNKYDAVLENGKSELSKEQAFYINKSNGITAKEAFNLLEGRSVHKELANKSGEKYKAWIKVDFNSPDEKGGFKLQQFSEKYGYDLEKTLAKYPIKELNDPEQKRNLLSSLEKGNVQQVVINKAGKEDKYFIEAVPQYKNINVYDHKMHTVKRQQIESGTNQKEAEKKENRNKQIETNTEAEEPKKTRSRKKKLSV